MKPRQILKIAVDCAMIAVLPFLMAFEPLDRKAHEWLGAGMLALFLLHHILNANWYKGLVKGRWNANRLFRMAVNTLLLLAMLGALISGMGMSRYVFHSLPIPGGRALFRRVHMGCVYWSFLLMGVHLGFHWSIFLNLDRKPRKGKPLSVWSKRVLRILTAGASCYGLYCFVTQGIPNYLFLRVEFAFFNAGDPMLKVILDLCAILTLWTAAGWLFQRWSSRKSRTGIWK